jgi:hypothetical protein
MVLFIGALLALAGKLAAASKMAGGAVAAGGGQLLKGAAGAAKSGVLGELGMDAAAKPAEVAVPSGPMMAMAEKGGINFADDVMGAGTQARFVELAQQDDGKPWLERMAGEQMRRSMATPPPQQERVMLPATRPLPVGTGSVQGPVSRRGGYGRPPMTNPNRTLRRLSGGPATFDAGYFQDGGSFRVPSTRSVWGPDPDPEWMPTTRPEDLDETGHVNVMMRLQPGEKVDVTPRTQAPAGAMLPSKIGPYADALDKPPMSVFLGEEGRYPGHWEQASRAARGPTNKWKNLASALFSGGDPMGGWRREDAYQKRQQMSDMIAEVYTDMARRAGQPGGLSYADEQALALFSSQFPSEAQWERPQSQRGQWVERLPGRMERLHKISRTGEETIGDPYSIDAPLREQPLTAGQQQAWAGMAAVQQEAIDMTEADWRHLAEQASVFDLTTGPGSKAEAAQRRIDALLQALDTAPPGARHGTRAYDQWRSKRAAAVARYMKAAGLAPDSSPMSEEEERIMEELAAGDTAPAPPAEPYLEPGQYGDQGTFEDRRARALAPYKAAGSAVMGVGGELAEGVRSLASDIVPDMSLPEDVQAKPTLYLGALNTDEALRSRGYPSARKYFSPRAPVFHGAPSPGAFPWQRR